MLTSKKYIMGFASALFLAGLYWLVLSSCAVSSNRKWHRRAEFLAERVEDISDSLDALGRRDNNVYRRLLHIPADTLPGQLRPSTSERDLYAAYAALDSTCDVREASLKRIASASRKLVEISSHIPSFPPIDPGVGRYTSNFGMRSDPFTQEPRMHTGIDIGCNRNTPVYAAADGVVEEIKNELNSYGNQVLLDHGYGFKTRYAHLTSTSVTVGMKVSRGENIAFTGNTGRSTSPHLHYEVLFKGSHNDPMDYIDLSMNSADFSAVAKKIDASRNINYVHPMHRKKK